MRILDTLGELLYWSGVIIGVPFAIAAPSSAPSTGPASPRTSPSSRTSTRETDRDVERAGPHIHAPLTARDEIRDRDSTSVTGFVSERDPERLELGSAARVGDI